MIYNKIRLELETLKNIEKITIFKGFFKTGQGEYGEGDEFIGLTVPQQRLIAKKYYKEANNNDITKLLDSPIHEYRLTELLILTYQYPKVDELGKKSIYHFYLEHKERINNWDLIDLTSPRILGDYIFHHRDQLSELDSLIKSDNLWDRRLAVMATFPFIRNREFELTLKYSIKLLSDKRDLINKVVGWMLREVGKRDEIVLLRFLDEYANITPRTMLRYAIEKLNSTQRDYYLGRKQ